MGVVKSFFRSVVFWLVVGLLLYLFLGFYPSDNTGYVGRFGDKYIEPDRAP